MMNNTFSAIDTSLLANICGGAATLPNGEINAPLQGGPAAPSFEPTFQGGPAQPTFEPSKPALPPEMQKWVDTMRSLEPWFKLGEAARKL